MDRRHLLRLMGSAAVLPLAPPRLDARPAPSAQPVDLAGLGLPELTVSMSADGYSVSSPEIPAGWVLVTFDNRAGDTANSADLMLVPPNESLDRLLESVAAPDAMPPSWIYRTAFAGAPWAPAGATAEAVVRLEAGDWAVFSPAPLTPARLTVTGGDAKPPAPVSLAPAVEVTMQEFAFVGLDGVLAAGPHLWKVTNAGHQPHLMTFGPVPAGTTRAQFTESLTAMMDGSPPPEASGPPGPPIAGGCSTLSAGASLYLALDLAPGSYGAVCFFPDPDSGAPHAMLGMTQIVEVAA